MSQTESKHRKPKNPKSPHNLARLERDLRAYELSLSGISVRGICEEIGLKSSQSAWAAIERGKKFALEKGIDIEERRIEIDKLFKRTLGLLVQTAQRQHLEGQIETIHSPEGTITKIRKGLDPRIAGELSRSLNRWAEFCGLLERAPEVNQANTTLIQLQAPTDGASFADRWGGGEALNVSPAVVGDKEPSLPADGRGLLPDSADQDVTSDAQPVQLAQELAQGTPERAA